MLVNLFSFWNIVNTHTFVSLSTISIFALHTFRWISAEQIINSSKWSHKPHSSLYFSLKMLAISNSLFIVLLKTIPLNHCTVYYAEYVRKCLFNFIFSLAILFIFHEKQQLKNSFHGIIVKTSALNKENNSNNILYCKT